VGPKYLKRARTALQQIAIRDLSVDDLETKLDEDAEACTPDDVSLDDVRKVASLAIVTLGWLYVSLLGDHPFDSQSLVVSGFMDEFYKLLDEDVLEGKSGQMWQHVSARNAEAAAAYMSKLAVQFIVECSGLLVDFDSDGKTSISLLEGGFHRLQRAFVMLAATEMLPARDQVFEATLRKLDELVNRYRRGRVYIEMLKPSCN
jgi:hypothetical protein